MDNQPPEITPELLQQHPVLMVGVLVIMGLFMAYVAGGIASWIFFGARLKAGKPILEVEPWSPRAWGLADLLVIILAAGAGQVLFAAIGLSMFDLEVAEGEIPIALAMWVGFGNLAAMVVGTIWISMRYGVSPAHVGFNSAGLARQAGLGLLVGLATLPVIYVLMVLVSLGFKTEYTHPLIDEMTRHGTLGVYVMGCITAAVIAPVTEEFLFRVVIQGWLQSIPFKSAFANVLGERLELLPNWQNEKTEALDMPEPLASSDSTWPYRPPNVFAVEQDQRQPAATDALASDSAVVAPIVPPIWPSIVTGVLFGLAHWGYGLSFIPLIALGIVLGLVYRATHSIWPCILIHCMLNGTSMALMGYAMLLQQVAG